MAKPRRFRKLRVLVSLVAGILFGCALGGAVVVILATQFFGYHVLAVQSPSMAPALAKGDLVVTKPTGAVGLHKGDIIYFKDQNGLPYIHRIASIRELTINGTTPQGKFVGSRTDYTFVTKGDANPAPDPMTVVPNEIQGQLWFHLGGLGSLASGGGLQVILLGIAGIVGVLWIAMELGPKLGRKKEDPGASAQSSNAPAPDDWSPESLPDAPASRGHV